MQPSARGRWQSWAGRIVPVLGVALLAAAPVHAKDKNKHHRDREVPAQAAPPSRSEGPPRDEPPRSMPPREDLREPPRVVREVSLDRVIEQVEKRHHARVVRSDTSASEGHKVYVLRLLSDEGRVWTVKVDAETGQEK